VYIGTQLSMVRLDLGISHTAVRHVTTRSLQHKMNPKKTKARFGRLLRPPAWKWRWPILVLVLHIFATYLLRHLPTYLQPRDLHRA